MQDIRDLEDKTKKELDEVCHHFQLLTNLLTNY
jgi:hypothetical protein